jgi:hypothetical protein
VTGEGGMVLTGDDEIAARIKILALHGMSKDAWKRFSDAGYNHYDVVEVGFKYNMMDLQAAIGMHQITGLSHIGISACASGNSMIAPREFAGVASRSARPGIAARATPLYAINRREDLADVA